MPAPTKCQCNCAKHSLSSLASVSPQYPSNCGKIMWSILLWTTCEVTPMTLRQTKRYTMSTQFLSNTDCLAQQSDCQHQQEMHQNYECSIKMKKHAKVKNVLQCSTKSSWMSLAKS